jgi:hypothetical protein
MKSYVKKFIIHIYSFEKLCKKLYNQNNINSMPFLGWVYKMFVRKLHDNQRRKIIEPLRDRFEQKLKMKSYICNHCGENFRPYQNQPCFAHRFETATLSPQFEKNVRNIFISKKGSLENSFQNLKSNSKKIILIS